MLYGSIFAHPIDYKVPYSESSCLRIRVKGEMNCKGAWEDFWRLGKCSLFEFSDCFVDGNINQNLWSYTLELCVV